MKERLNKNYFRRITVIVMMIALVFALMPPMTASGATPKAPPQVKSVKVRTTSASSVRLSWAKPKKAKGYQIYMATVKSSKYTLIKTITSSEVITYTKTGLKPRRQYRFKVRAYTSKDKKNIYGQFSAIKIVTI